MPAVQPPIPSLPEIGCPETYYARQIHRAERDSDIHSREAYKVGQYITLAMDPTLTWLQKMRYFRHALQRHCTAPPLPDEQVWLFYRQLTHLIRDYAGREALRLASVEDDVFARRWKADHPREQIQADARTFFGELMGSAQGACPDHFHEEDWTQLNLLRNQWA